QLHGDESKSELMQLKNQAYKAIRPKDQLELEGLLQNYANPLVMPNLLVDTFNPNVYGGSGESGNWSLAKIAASKYKVLLAGGLNTENVALAIHSVAPWGVDVASGVESRPGKKDIKKMKEFVHRAKEV
ncbi:MAG: phosphoribosylanthranilate isomerase, partial [Anaerolineales bacterium]